MLMQPALLTSKPYRQSPNVVSGFVFYLHVFTENVCEWACGSQRTDAGLGSFLPPRESWDQIQVVRLGAKYPYSAIRLTRLHPSRVSIRKDLCVLTLLF